MTPTPEQTAAASKSYHEYLESHSQDDGWTLSAVRWHFQETSELRSQLATAEKAVRELERDKERLDWFDCNQTEVCQHVEKGYYVWNEEQDGYNDFYPTLRQALDAAMNREGK